MAPFLESRGLIPPNSKSTSPGGPRLGFPRSTAGGPTAPVLTLSLLLAHPCRPRSGRRRRRHLHPVLYHHRRCALLLLPPAAAALACRAALETGGLNFLVFLNLPLDGTYSFNHPCWAHSQGVPDTDEHRPDAAAHDARLFRPVSRPTGPCSLAHRAPTGLTPDDRHRASDSFMGYVRPFSASFVPN